MSDDLLPAARETFAELDAIVRAGIDTYIEVGRALMRIRDEQLYRLDYPTFAAYCRDVAGRSRAWAYKMMSGAAIHDAVLSTGVDIQTATAAQALAKFPAEHRPTIAQAAAKAAEVMGKPLTAASLTRVGETVMQAVTTGAADVNGEAYPLGVSIAEGEVEAVKRAAELMRARRGLQRVEDSSVEMYREGDYVTLRLPAPPGSTFVIYMRCEEQNER